MNYLLCLLQLILSPENGWEDISHEGRESRLIASRGYFPFIALVGLTPLLHLFYSTSPTSLSEAIIAAVVTFVRYFLAYFITMFIFPLKVGDYVEGEINEKRLNTYVLYSLGLMALVTFIANVVPIIDFLGYFLIIYVAIIMWKGCRYMGVKPSCEGYFMLLALASVMLPVYLLEWLFHIITR